MRHVLATYTFHVDAYTAMPYRMYSDVSKSVLQVPIVAVSRQYPFVFYRTSRWKFRESVWSSFVVNDFNVSPAVEIIKRLTVSLYSRLQIKNHWPPVAIHTIESLRLQNRSNRLRFYLTAMILAILD